MSNRRLIALQLALLFVAGRCGVACADDAKKKDGSAKRELIEHFEKSVRPLLLAKCVECHGPKEQEAGLRLDTAQGLFRGGESGPVVVPRQVDKSRLIQVVRGAGDVVMPPETKLKKSEIAALVKWVKTGAVWPGYKYRPGANKKGAGFTKQQKAFWSFQPVKNYSLPQVKRQSWPVSPVDAFILAKLESVGLEPASSADRRTLLRRVTYDLTGLPPTPDEIKAFVNDSSPKAFETVVDRLLASPRYGERWGRHWLDVARFAESAAHDGNNAYLHAWRYRDYVIDAFNKDKPYDQFVVEQLAGDLLPKTGKREIDFERMVATGFLQVGPKPVVMRDKKQMLLDIADEQIAATGTAFMGLTLACARCHDHKFDPLLATDYYSFAGIFMSTHIMEDQLPDSKWIEPTVEGSDGQKVRVMAVEDQPKPVNLRVHLRGNYRTLGAEAPRRFLQIIAGEKHPPIQTKGSGRLELARWIASANHPLTARVMVNRIWQHHFGSGLVASSNDFGARGDKPSHPMLLDWLASRFVESGWSIKAMHRLMFLSKTYQQAYVENADAEQVDPNNRLLWCMPRRRLSAEEIRDSLLAVSGELDASMGGTLFTSGYTFNDKKRELAVVDIGDPAKYPPFQAPRRSVYLPMIRNQMPPMLTLFDVANEHESTAVRSQTTIAPQSLFLLNSQFVRERSLALARLLEANTESSDEQRIHTLYLLTLGRPPEEVEVQSGRQFLEIYQAEIDPDNSRQRAAKTAESLASTSYESQIRGTAGLVAYYRLNERGPHKKGQPVVANHVGGGKADGLYVGNPALGRPGAIHAASPDAKTNTSIALNGKDQKVTIEDVESLNFKTREISVEYWVNPSRVAEGMTIGRDDLAAGVRYWKSGLFVRKVNGVDKNIVSHEFFGQGGLRMVADARSVAEVNQWTHVVFTFGDSRRRLYVNGQMVDELNVSGNFGAGPVPLTLGARRDNVEWLQAGLDEVAIYNRVLEGSTVRRHYTVGSGHPPKEDGPYSPRLMAWRSYCQALLCMNEFIFVD
jgi:cytochrome c553